MIKKDLINKIFEKTGIPKQDAETIVNHFIQILKESIENGEEIEFRGLGCFRIQQRKARPGRDFKTGKAVLIPLRRIVKFIPSKNLKIR
jgi:nucleoid DNA-binding protein